MSSKTIAMDILKRIEAALEQLHTTGVPGNVKIEIHSDGKSVKKVNFSTEEAWPVG